MKARRGTRLTVSESHFVALRGILQLLAFSLEIRLDSSCNEILQVIYLNTAYISRYWYTNWERHNRLGWRSKACDSRGHQRLVRFLGTPKLRDAKRQHRLLFPAKRCPHIGAPASKPPTLINTLQGIVNLGIWCRRHKIVPGQGGARL